MDRNVGVFRLWSWNFWLFLLQKTTKLQVTLHISQYSSTCYFFQTSLKINESNCFPIMLLSWYARMNILLILFKGPYVSLGDKRTGFHPSSRALHTLLLRKIIRLKNWSLCCAYDCAKNCFKKTEGLREKQIVTYLKLTCYWFSKPRLLIGWQLVYTFIKSVG